MIFFIYLPSSIFSVTISDAASLMEKKEYQKSIEILDSLITDNPEYAIAHLYRGYAYMMLEKYENALSDYKKADEISSTVDSLLGIQWALLASGKNDESIEVGKKILEIDPNSYYGKQRIADAYLEKKEYAVASEKYKEMQVEYGKNADLLWKIGLCEYYIGNKDEAKKLFQEGNKLAPEHKGIQYSLSNAESGYSYFAVIPEYTSYNFKGSDFLGSGQKYGLGFSYSPNENWNIRASFMNDKTENLNSTKGVENYLVDPVNLLYISRLPPNATVTGYYLNSAYNVYNLANLLTAQDYVTNKYYAGMSYKWNERYAFHFTPHFLQSNSSLLNGGSALQAGISYTDKYTLTFSGASISAPQSKGGQFTANLYYPFMEKFYSSSTLNAQSMTVKSTEYVFISSTPLLVTSETVNVNKSYAFFQQEFGYMYKYFYAGFGGRYGTARTPIMGENWIYTGFDLLSGGFAQIGIKTEKLTLQLQYSQDKWLDSRGEKPTSDAIKFMIIGRF
ncbi:MAG: tetratricopeptide repeat protein [Leptospiraceae bacterium]|nr:tetratricopeptide repeat protein [Leptospiraceae bacterium]